MLIVDSGTKSSTKEVVAEVRNWKNSHEQEFDSACKEYLKVYRLAKEALYKGDVQKIGEAMNYNHSLLKRVGVSNEKIEQIIDTCESEGVLGAKLTGAGKGGMVIALCHNQEKIRKIAGIFESVGHKAYIVNI